MKRSFAFLLTVILLLTGFGSFAESDDYKIVYPKALKAKDYSVKTWCATDTTREYFVIYMVSDCSLSDRETTILAEAMVYDSLYLVQDDNDVSVFAFGEDSIFMFIYNPSQEAAFYTTSALGDLAWAKSASYMQALQDQGQFSTYYKLDGTSILDRIDKITD